MAKTKKNLKTISNVSENAKESIEETSCSKKHIVLTDRRIALLALVVAFGSFIYPMIKDLFSNREMLVIKLDSAYFDENPYYQRASLTEYGLGGTKSYIVQNYEFVISNVTNKPISITKIVLDSLGNNGRIMIDAMNDGKLYIGKDEITLPINIDANESILLRTTLRIAFNSGQDDLIQKKYSYGANIPIEEIKKLLFENGFDIWGNKTKELLFGIYAPIGEYSFPEYRIRMISSKKNEFKCQFNEFSGERDIDMFEKYRTKL